MASDQSLILLVTNLLIMQHPTNLFYWSTKTAIHPDTFSADNSITEADKKEKNKQTISIRYKLQIQIIRQYRMLQIHAYRKDTSTKRKIRQCWPKMPRYQWRAWFSDIQIWLPIALTTANEITITNNMRICKHTATLVNCTNYTSNILLRITSIWNVCMMRRN